jgi:2-polyprenyl-3-methyl-5-hydroxy-6-metoxy-1,4-benzoquinol methylase
MNSVAAAWNAYAGEGLAARLHVAVRALTCPFGQVIDRFPTSGAVLDVGCGHGLLLHLLARDPEHGGLALHGIDHDAAKIATAQRTARPGVAFSTTPLEAVPAAAYDAVSIFDVLYTVRREVWPEILRGCHRALRPGGRLIVKEVIDRPRWKYWAIMAQETLSVSLLGITKGDPPHFESPEGYRRAMAEAGFQIAEARPLSTASWISHYLFVGLKN